MLYAEPAAEHFKSVVNFLLGTDSHPSSAFASRSVQGYRQALLT
jgi:hypothetical protein